MKAYKTGQRKNDTMKAMLAAVSDKAMANVALFYALQKPARAKTPPPATRVPARPPRRAAAAVTAKTA